MWDSSASGVSWNMVRGRLVYGAAGFAVAVDVEGGGHDGHGHILQQGEGGVGQHGKTRGKTGGHGQWQHDECGDQVEVGVPGGLKKVLAGRMKSCHILKWLKK